MIQVSKQFAPVTLVLTTKEDVSDMTGIMEGVLERMANRFAGKIPASEQEYYSRIQRLVEQLERTRGT